MRRCGFSLLEVVLGLAILSLLAASVLAFTYGVGERRQRLAYEGRRLEALSRVMDRLERAAAGAVEPPTISGGTLEVESAGVWPALGSAGVPVSPEPFTGRLRFARGELRWGERSEDGRTLELAVAGVQAVAFSRFRGTAVGRGSGGPVRVSIWLAPYEPEPVTLTTDQPPDAAQDAIADAPMGAQGAGQVGAGQVGAGDSPASGGAGEGLPARAPELVLAVLSAPDAAAGGEDGGAARSAGPGGGP